MTVEPLTTLAELPGVPAAVEAARVACAELRWHPALRRLTERAQAESLVRAARASAALDGAEVPLERARLLLDGAGSPDPVEAVVARAVRVTAIAAQLGGRLTSSPAQALARLQVAAAEPGAPLDQLGRPRSADAIPGELVDLGPAPAGRELAERLEGLTRLLVGAGDAPVLVLAAVVHGELLALRPFPSGNGLVARAAARALMVHGGLDPTGVAVPEVGLLARGAPGYLSAAAGYLSGTAEGTSAWIEFCAEAVVVGAREGTLVADAVLAGRLPA